MIGDSAIGVVAIGELAPSGAPTSYTLTAQSGTYSLTGVSAGLRADRRIAPAVGSYSLTGIATGLRAARRIAPAVGSYSLTGNTANLIYTPAGAYTLIASAGSYTLTGNAVGLRATRRIAPAVGSYNITGNSAGLLAGRRVSPTTGAYNLTGNSAGLRATRRIAPAVGSYSLSGTAAGLRSGRRLAPAVGSYSLTGNTANLVKGSNNPILTALSGSYVITPIPTRLVGPPRGISRRSDIVTEQYSRRALDVSADKDQLIAFLIEELRRIENNLRDVTDGSPQVVDREPLNKRRGMVRYAVNPWNPGSGDGLYVYNGTTWDPI